MSMSRGGGETQLTDERLAAEIALLGEVITVVSTHSGPLSPDEVDDVLGVGDPAAEVSDLEDLEDLDALGELEPADPPG
jgi:hypothetical protein